MNNTWQQQTIDNPYLQLFEEHAELLKSLAHPRRLEILQLLRQHSMNVTQLQAMLNLPQANLSQHLQVLREAGVVQTERHGKEVLYSLAHPYFIEASDLLREILVERHRHDSLATTLDINMLDLVPLHLDPVCGMRVSPKTAGLAEHYKDTTYYFCASGCWKAFQKHPEEYVSE